MRCSALGRAPPRGLRWLDLGGARAALRSGRCGVATLNGLYSSGLTRRDGVAAAGLWSGHRLTPPPLRHSHLHQIPGQGQPAAVGRVRSSPDAARAAASSSSPSNRDCPSARDCSTELLQSFAFDPPFTAITGEAGKGFHDVICVYACRRCHSPLFSSKDLMRGSRVGHHCSGWPTFVAPLTRTALRLRTTPQRSVVAGSSDAPSVRSPGFSLRVPASGVAQRGLAVEGDVVRLHGRPVGVRQAQSWREMCLRDENHRADPAIVLGCCGHCGIPVCQVTHSAAEGSRYVATASCIDVLDSKVEG
ncbi:hypothetical protein ABL78_5599 [Leptomonas seymouri]|uniref:Uncharacterized protein n=1 Tax=Leptomonas seymouri TaxID=5684 RepID=A0A0N1I3B1_LEPSE|nr:hypothetical protein ABL78_5599 [Leptomonas seymouri]|eukprot:KPI85344.1 hypothetical protein ABL78_5599 [Leptomonas seymouri]